MREGSAARRLIVNADDFGVTEGVSRGILRAHREGLVTSTTVLASLPPQPELDVVARDSAGLGLGLHFNLTLGRPVSPPETVGSLVDAEGRFRRDLAVLQERARPDEVRRECEAQIEAFTRRFGENEYNIFGERWSVPGHPEIVVLSNITEGGRPTGVLRAGENWHSDMCYTARPPRGTILYAIEVPELHGLPLGDTEFASAAAAWDALPDAMKRSLEGRRAVFDFRGRKRALTPTQAEIDRLQAVRQQCPEEGR